MNVLDIVRRIGHFEFSLSIMRALRAKIESNYGFKNRIGKSFKDGFRGVLAVGEAGAGKTKTLQNIFYGLELNLCNHDRAPIGVWLSSGISTGVGLFELLIQHNDAVIVIDELDANTKLHINILKQIASGEICRMKHGETHPVPFSGILLGATNGIPFNARNTSHLVAMLERFSVVYMESTHPETYYVTDECTEELSKEDWRVIIRALSSRCNYDLTDNEHEIGRQLFNDKLLESLDADKAMFRQAQDVQDILVFLKRLCCITDISCHDEIVEVARNLVRHTVHVNPAKLLSMNPIERSVYNYIDKSENGSVPFITLVDYCNNTGIMIDARTMRAMLNQMVKARILNKYAGDLYATKVQTATETQSVMAGAL